MIPRYTTVKNMYVLKHKDGRYVAADQSVSKYTTEFDKAKLVESKTGEEELDIDYVPVRLSCTYTEVEMIRNEVPKGPNTREEIKEAYREPKRVINKFNGQYAWLSNFASVGIFMDGLEYPSVEHAFQAAKTLDHNKREEVLTMTPGQAKKWGRTVQLRVDWEEVKLNIMLELLHQKFSNVGFRSKLLATGTAELIEGNDWGDTYWGVYKGKGQNHLGRLIMRVRDSL